MSTVIPSAWGTFRRGSMSLTTGEVLLDDWYATDGDPVLMLQTPDAGLGRVLLARLTTYFDDPAGWQRRATDAIATEFSSRPPSPADLAEAADDLVLTTVEVHPGGDLVLHFDDSCGKDFLDGYWPSVRFDAATAATDVAVEA